MDPLEKMFSEMEAKIRRDKAKKANTQGSSQQLAEAEYECPRCKDKEFIFNHEANTATPCECREIKVIRRLIKSSGLTESQRKVSFDNLDPNRSNRQLYWVARKYLQKFDEIAASDAENKGIGFTGSVGAGKTTLLLAVANGLIDRQIPVIFVNTPDLIGELYDAQFGRDNESLNSKIHKLGTVEVAIFDDVGTERITDWVQTQYYRIINSRYNNRLPTLFTSNLSFDDLSDKIGDRAASRLYALTRDRLIEIEAEDYRLV